MNYKWCILQEYAKGLIDPFGFYPDSIFEVFDKCKERKFSLFFRVLRKIPLFKRKVPYSLCFASDWVNKIDKYENFIIFTVDFAESIARFIKKRNPNAHCYVYSWDIRYVPQNVLSYTLFDDIGTFDFKQAQSSKIKFYSQFYGVDKTHLNEIAKEFNQENRYTFALIAQNKNREHIIKSIKEKCDAYDTKSFFKIIEKNKERIPYSEYLDIVKKSKCIIDVVVEGQSGLSLRPMEALFFEKKLITNNASVRDYDFYDKNNIFIYGVDDDLNSFMNLLKT